VLANFVPVGQVLAHVALGDPVPRLYLRDGAFGLKTAKAITIGSAIRNQRGLTAKTTTSAGIVARSQGGRRFTSG